MFCLRGSRPLRTISHTRQTPTSRRKYTMAPSMNFLFILSQFWHPTLANCPSFAFMPLQLLFQRKHWHYFHPSCHDSLRQPSNNYLRPLRRWQRHAVQETSRQPPHNLHHQYLAHHTRTTDWRSQGLWLLLRRYEDVWGLDRRRRLRGARKVRRE